MAQIFPRSANTVARVSIAVALLAVIGAGWATDAVFWAPYTTRVKVPMDQPVPFSHKHHVAGLGIDCRYCHASVEKSAFAGLPPTETCMTCHSQIWRDAPILDPVRASLRDNKPLRWNRVHDLPDFVYFNHSIHVNRGIGCSTCHGPVDRMPLMWKEQTLYMKWCLDCHKHPEREIRPRDQVFNMQWQKPADQKTEGAKLVAQRHVNTAQLIDCSVCHR
jgi:cytochrome c7-like protein